MSRKKIIACLVVLVAAILCVGYVATSGSNVNKAFSKFESGAAGDTILAVEISGNEPGGSSAGKQEIFEHSKSPYSSYIRLVPRYAESSVKIEEMGIDLEKSLFVPTGVLFETKSTDDYVLLLRTDLPEGGPNLRVTVEHKGKTAVYEPVFDGSDDTVYPITRNGYVLYKN